MDAKAHAKAKEAYKKQMRGDRYKPGKAYSKGKKGLGMRKKFTAGR